MSKKEIRDFLMQGTLTGKLATVKQDGSSHVVPIWFVLDDNGNKNMAIYARYEISYILVMRLFVIYNFSKEIICIFIVSML